MKHLVIGFGDVGSGLAEIIHGAGEGVTVIDIGNKEEGQFKIMHICFPYSNTFITEIDRYIGKHKPEMVIVHSTVPPGTTEKINFPVVVHSPIRGRHLTMGNDIKVYLKYFGGEHAEEAAKLFQDMGLKTKCFENSKTTELGKLLSNIRWGLHIAFAQEQRRICKHFGIEYEDVVNDFEQSRNEGLSVLNRKKARLPVLFPGYIGKHCVMPNTEILMNEYKSDFLKAIIESNEKYTKGL